MKIGILTMFNGLSNTYSLVNVVKEQIKMLLDDGMQVKMLVSEHCPDSERSGIFLDTRIEWVKIVNSENQSMFHWKTYTKKDDIIEKDFFHQANIIKCDFVKHLQDVDVLIMHDILYQGVHLIHNVAIRLAQKELPGVRFIAVAHSAPIEHIDAPYPISCMFCDMKNTKFVYPTQCGLQALSKQYQTDIKNCACVNNSIDVMIGMNEQTKSIVKTSGIINKDVVIVYPARLTMGKKLHKVAQVAGYIKRYCYKSVGVVFCDFPCSNIDPELYKNIILDYGIKGGLDKEDIVFTSDIGFSKGVKRETVFDLFSLSNLFICPSFSESFGLTVIEAASRANFIVLNEAVPALDEIGKKIGAYFMRWDAKNFGYDTFESYNPSESIYLIDHAQKIVSAMELDVVVKAKTLARCHYSNDWIYKNQLKPLLY
ncbi:MAG: glycosyltransferase [Oscillospiraceae bacterium]